MPAFVVSSLRTRLIILIVAAVLPALGFIFYTASDQRSQRESQIREEAMHTARLAASNIEQLVMGSRQVLIGLSKLPTVRNYDSSACNDYFSAIKGQLPMYANIAAAKPNGDIFCSAVSPDRKVNVADRLYFKAAIQKKDYFVGEYVMGRIYGKPTINLAVPALGKDQKPRAVVYVALDLNWFRGQLNEIRIPEQTILTVVDRNKTILYRNPDADNRMGTDISGTELSMKTKVQEEGTAVAKSLDGITRIFAFVPVVGTDKGIYVRYGISRTAAFAGINRMIVNNLLVLFGIALLAIATAWVGTDYFVMRRMKKLMKATDALSKGDLSARVDTDGQSDEIGQLSSRFNKMAEALELQNEKRRQTEELLWEDHERLDLALQSAHMGVWRWEISENKRYFDDQVCNLLGLDSSTFRGTPGEFFGAVHHEDREKLRMALSRTLENNVPYEEEYRVVWPDGSIHYVNARGRLFHDNQGKPLRINGTLWDVTERKIADEELYKRNSRLETILQASPAAIYTMDNEGIVLTWNKGSELMFGWSEEEAIGRKNPIVSHENREAFDANRRKIANGEPFLNVELLRQRKDGSPIYISMFATPMYATGGDVTGIMSIAIDLTRQKKMEKEHAALEIQLRQSQKMEAIGQLAGGVAHDFNNILSAIVGYSHLTLMKKGEDDLVRHNIQQILASSERAAVLTQSLLAFSRKQMVNLARIDLGEVIAKFEKLLLRLVRESIEFKTMLTDQALPVMADRGQIEQILMNLVANARDAMPNGGRIIIETGRVILDKSFIEAHGFGRAGNYALLSVTDTGTGIPEDIRSKIFDPFFTTKEEGRGTGLGLSLVYGIVKKHDGFINVYSQLGTGTTFKIYLPLLHETEEATEEKQAEQAPLRGGNETILLAEDDASVRALTASVLRHYGYTVIEAMDGQDSVVKFTDGRDSIRIVVLDGIMPKMNGKEAWKAIRELSPGVKAIFVSGYAEDIFTKDGIPDRDAAFIQKPSSPSVLVRKIREVLDE